MITILLGKECSPFLEIDDSLLQRADLRLVWAESVDAFVPLAREHRPAIVVLDPKVPGLDALATTRTLLEGGGDAPLHVYLIGNAADHERASAAEAAGAAGLVTRPLTQARLLEILRRQKLVPERDDDRVEIALKVEIARGDDEGLAYTRDLGLEGCFLHTHEPFEVGEGLRLAFQLPVPGKREMRVAGTVLRVETGESSGGIAVRFTGLTGPDRAELARFLRSRGRGVA